MLFFNAEHGYLDAILRGFKTGLITKSQYTNFTQCETIEGKRPMIRFQVDHVVLFDLEDLRIQLTSATDYSEVLQSISSGVPMKPALLGGKLREKYVRDFAYLRSNATGDLATFLDYITYTVVAVVGLSYILCLPW